MANYTHQEITQLAKSLREAKGRKQPFALLTGAGCSKAAGIPLATELVTEINQKYAHEIQGLSEAEKQDYGQCMGKLPLNRRRELLDPYLREIKLNWAHIAIASLISTGYVQRVLTVNFDNVLARACGLCGIYPATYDYATGATPLTGHIIPPSIIHLHGQGYGARLINDRSETAEHTRLIVPLLRQTLADFPLLVVGYSGLCDPIFTTLEENYGGQETLHWCSYANEPEPHLEPLIKKAQVHHYGGVDSDTFLVHLAQLLECFPPTVFKTPVEHLRHEIKNVVPFPLRDRNGEVDILSKMQTRLDHYEELEKQDQSTSVSWGLLTQLLSGKTKEMITAYENGEIPLTDDIRENLATAYFQQALKSENHQEKAQLNQQAVAIKPDEHQAFYNWGLALSKLGQYAEAGEKYAQAVAIKPDYHQAFYNWGVALDELGQYAEAGEKYAQAVAIKPDEHQAFYNWGVALSKLGQYAEAGEKYAQAVAIKPDEHQAFYNWGVALDELGQYAEAGEKYAQAVAIKPDFPDALNNWGSALLRLFHETNNHDVLSQAKTVIEQALVLSSHNTYNAACLAALMGDELGCQRHLSTAREAGILPGAAHLQQDRDMDFVRDKAWFKALLESG